MCHMLIGCLSECSSVANVPLCVQVTLHTDHAGEVPLIYVGVLSSGPPPPVQHQDRSFVQDILGRNT